MNDLSLVSVFAISASSLVKLHLEGDKMTVSSQDIDFSTAAIETLSINYSGEPMNIGFRATLLIEILNYISSQEIILELADGSRPGLILPVENAEHED